MNVINGRTSYDLRYVLDTTLEQRINEVFVDYFELTPCPIKSETSFADSIYDDDKHTFAEIREISDKWNESL